MINLDINSVLIIFTQTVWVLTFSYSRESRQSVLVCSTRLPTCDL